MVRFRGSIRRSGGNRVPRPRIAGPRNPERGGRSFPPPPPAAGGRQGSGTLGASVFARGRSDAMTTMTHDGYVARIELDGEASLFHVEVIRTGEVMRFLGGQLG